MAIKKALQATVAYMNDNNTMTVADILADPKFTKLVEAGKGGFNGEDSFVTIDNNKVARVCAMTGAVFAHDNTDKLVSFFYKNGSYMIGAEIVKANSRKVWEADRTDREAELEEQMLEGEISPKEWKEANLAIQAETFEFTLDEDTKAQLIADYQGYETKEAFIEAYEADTVPAFEEFAEFTEALRAEGKPTEEV